MTLPRRKTLVYFALSLTLIAVAVVWMSTPQTRVGKTFEPLKRLL